MSENWDYIHAYPHTHARVDLYNSTELQSDRLFSVTFIFVFSMNFQASVGVGGTSSSQHSLVNENMCGINIETLTVLSESR